MLPDLITLEDAVTALSAAGQPPTGARLAALPGQIAAASADIRRWCGDRAFSRQTLVEDHSPDRDGVVFLDQFPVISVGRIAGDPVPAIRLAVDPATTRRATVAGSADGSGVVLTRVAAGVTSPVTVPFGTGTVATFAAAIAAVAGWSGTVGPGQGDWPAADLVTDPTPRSALHGLDLCVHADDFPARDLDRATGQLRLDWWAHGPVRVTYDAGFAEVPASIRQATALLAGHLLDNLGRDLALKSETVGAGSYTTRDAAGWPDEVLQRIAPYRIVRV